MDIGIGTYALFWEFDERNPRPLDIAGMIDRASVLDCDVFQICDDPRIEQESDAGLESLRSRARDGALRLELGTRTIDHDHLSRYLDIADALGARTLRSMIQAREMDGGVVAAAEQLRALLPRLEASGTTLALETYEQVPTPTLLEILDRVDSPLIGICLDPANCVSALEHPAQVIGSCAARTANLHVKDARFTRQEGWVGFSYSGAPLGEGLLDLDHELRAVYSEDRCPSAVVEHWVPWQGDIAETVATERRWTERAMSVLRAWRAQHRPGPAHHG